MNSSALEHIFFDLDHTLWDFDRNSKLAYQEIFEKNDVQFPIDQFIAIYEPLNLEFWRKYRNNELTREELKYQRLKTAFDACEFAVSDENINLFADLYLEYLPKYNHLFKGCIAMLTDLSSTFNLHCITNGFIEVQEKKLVNSNLKPFFKTILTAEEAGVKKPDPAIFKIALDRAGARPSNSLMIGDSYEADILGARNMGMQTIYFDPLGLNANKEGVRVDELPQITSLLLS
jgi:putative hydrolase of the HAD superfamily